MHIIQPGLYLSHYQHSHKIQFLIFFIEEGTYESQVPRAPPSRHFDLLTQTNQDSHGGNSGWGTQSSKSAPPHSDEALLHPHHAPFK